MNHTHIALLALLLPLSGYSITKEDRKKELEARLEKITHDIMMIQMQYMIAFPINLLTMTQEKAEKISKELEEKIKEIDAMNEEYQSL